MTTYPFLNLIYKGDWMAPWVIRSTENLLTPTSTCNLDHTTIQPTYRPFFLPCVTEPGLSVTRKASRKSWSTKEIWQTFNPVVRTSKLEEKPPQLLFFCMSRQHMAGSTECWPNRTLMCWTAPKKISSLLCPVKDELGLRTPEIYSIPC